MRACTLEHKGNVLLSEGVRSSSSRTTHIAILHHERDALVHIAGAHTKRRSDRAEPFP